jgi:hypothetical protein
MFAAGIQPALNGQVFTGSLKGMRPHSMPADAILAHVARSLSRASTSEASTAPDRPLHRSPTTFGQPGAKHTKLVMPDLEGQWNTVGTSLPNALYETNHVRDHPSRGR